MLVHLQDTDGRDIWINPIHVKVLRTKKGIFGGGKKGTEIWLGWTGTSEAIVVPQDPTDIAAAMNTVLAMMAPRGISPQSLAALDSSDEDHSGVPNAGS